MCGLDSRTRLEQTGKQAFFYFAKQPCLKKRHSDKSPDGSTIEAAIANFPEKCSAVGVSRELGGSYSIIAPYGLDDLFTETIVPTGAIDELAFKRRIERKKWLTNFQNSKLG